MLLLKHVVACQKDNPTTRIVLTTPESKPVTKKTSNKNSPKIVKTGGGRKTLKNSDGTNDSFDSKNTENLANNEENPLNLKSKKNRKSTTKRRSELFIADDNTTEIKDIVENNANSAGNQLNKRRISKKIKPLNNVNTIEVQNKSAKDTLMNTVDISNNERSYIGNHIADNNVQNENKTEDKTGKESLNNKEGNIFLASYININKFVIRYLKLLIV